MGGPLIIVVVIFLIEFTVAGTLIYKGYIQSINKNDFIFRIACNKYKNRQSLGLSIFITFIHSILKQSLIFK